MRDLGGVDRLKTKPVERDGGSSLSRRDFLLAFAEGLREERASAVC